MCKHSFAITCFLGSLEAKKKMSIPVILIFFGFILNQTNGSGEGCLQSIPTRTVVAACPKGITEWIKAKRRKMCHSISQNCTTAEKFEYHCLPNTLLDLFVEVCAPTKVIIGQHCPSYNMDLNVIETNFNQPCKDHLTPCLDVYQSNTIYNYPECFKEFNNKEADNIAGSIVIAHDNTVLNNGLYVICISLVVLIILLFINICCPRKCTGMYKRVFICGSKTGDRKQTTDEELKLKEDNTENNNRNVM